MVKITEMIYSLVDTVKGIKTLRFIKVIDKNKDRSGWARISYEEFKKHGFYPDSLNRAIKECIRLGILDIDVDESAKGIKKGAIPRKYRLKMSLNQIK